MSKKLLKVTFSSIFVLIIFINCNAYATYDGEIVTQVAEDEIQNVLEVETQIYKFDKKTNETTIVNLEDISKDLNVRSTTNKATNNISLLNSFRAGYQFYFANNGKVPYKYVCKIKNDESKHGTGFLVGPNLLFTCAHCVFDDKDPDKTFQNWVCYPAYDGPSEAPISSGWDTIYYSSGYTSIFDSVSNQHDWCLCVLSEPLGDEMGNWLSCISYSDNSNLDLMSIQAVGYPHVFNEETNSYDFFGNTMYYSLGNISNVNQYFFDSDAKTYRGMSGGPIMNMANNQVVGIVKGDYEINPDKTYAVRFTHDIINLINSLY